MERIKVAKVCTGAAVAAILGMMVAACMERCHRNRRCGGAMNVVVAVACVAGSLHIIDGRLGTGDSEKVDDISGTCFIKKHSN